MIAGMRLPKTLGWLVDEAAALAGADAFLGGLGARLIADGVPLAGGALTLSAPHPIIARRSFLWRAETGAVIEALGFGMPGLAASDPADAGRTFLEGLGAGEVRTFASARMERRDGRCLAGR